MKRDASQLRTKHKVFNFYNKKKTGLKIEKTRETYAWKSQAKIKKRAKRGQF